MLLNMPPPFFFSCGRSWEPEACQHALMPHSYIDGDGLTSGTRSLCAEDDELDAALRSAGVF